MAELRKDKLGLTADGTLRFLAHSSGSMVIQDATENDVMTLEAHHTRHEPVGADALDTTIPWNFSNTSSTFGNVKGTLQIDAIELAASAGANNFSWNITFSSTPKAVATPVNTSSTGLSWSFDSVTTSGGTFNISAASTVNIIGIAGY